ncbi:hypothetical protein ACPUEK_05345 [Marinomonas gallaica]|uniref:hypothetical protein n=1 Tax=Marinomonas gallaica TaxID=1806667 RepID=UPI003CE4A604
MMDDQGFSAPFPSWVQFFLFNIVFFLGIGAVGIFPIVLLSCGYLDIERAFVLIFLLTLILFIISALSFNGVGVSKKMIMGQHLFLIFSFLLLLKNEASQLWPEIVAMLCSISAVLLVQTKSYKNFVWYRSKHRKFLKNMKIKIKESGF